MTTFTIETAVMKPRVGKGRPRVDHWQPLGAVYKSRAAAKRAANQLTEETTVTLRWRIIASSVAYSGGCTVPKLRNAQ